MRVSTVVQPHQQLGHDIVDLLDSTERFSRIILVSAFVGLRTVLRLRDRLLQHFENGAELKLTVGIDLGGTSKEVLEELLRWECNVFVFHNPNPRATFHPKIYLFEKPDSATLFIGSNNLTDGGFYTNYETSSRYDFELPSDDDNYRNILQPLDTLINPHAGDVSQPLTDALIQTLAQRGALPSEVEARRSNRGRQRTTTGIETIPANPFTPVTITLPPLLPRNQRQEATPVNNQEPPEIAGIASQPVLHIPEGTLVWRKILPASDALQVLPGTHHVGGVRLVQAKFESPLGQRIDQKTYFRQLFSDYNWETETGRNRRYDQEHTFVPMRLVILNNDYGVHFFEISHKPSGEAGQANYTTILKWGQLLNPVIQEMNIAGKVLSLYGVNLHKRHQSPIGFCANP